MISILLADDHEIVRRGLRALLEERDDWKVLAEASTGREAVDRAVDLRPDVALLDYTMPELNGLEATRRIKALAPKTEVLIFSMHDSEVLVRDVLAAGARGYVLKSDATAKLADAVEELAHHRPFFSGVIAESILQTYLRANADDATPPTSALLTSREWEIVQLLAEGHSNREVSGELSISVKTVETHRAAVMRKLHLDSLADLVRFAIRNNVVAP